MPNKSLDYILIRLKLKPHITRTKGGKINNLYWVMKIQFLQKNLLSKRAVPKHRARKFRVPVQIIGRYANCSSYGLNMSHQIETYMMSFTFHT